MCNGRMESLMNLRVSAKSVHVGCPSLLFQSLLHLALEELSVPCQGWKLCPAFHISLAYMDMYYSMQYTS